MTDIERSRVVAPLERAWTLPPRAYTEPAVFEREVEAIFRRDWVCVARTEQISEPGRYLTVDVIDQPVVVTRDRDGTLRAMSNVCLHRAMPLVEGAGATRWMVCPYHQWSYGLDGRLHTAPLMDGVEEFEPAGCQLPQLAVETWEGFVFVSLDPDAAPLAPRLEPLRKRLENYHLDELVIAQTLEYESPWNWKVMIENFMEAYHHIGAHRDTFQHTNPAHTSFVVDNETGPWSLLMMPGKDEVGEHSDLPFLSGLEIEQRTDLLAACMFPTGLLSVSGTLGAWYEMIPRRHDLLTLRIHVLLEPHVAADPDVRAAMPLITEGVRWIHGEDIPANSGPWRGLHAPLTGQGRLSLYEGAIWQLNQLWLDRLENG